MNFYWDKLKKIRISKNLSLIAVAKDIGISRGTLWSWELGARIPREKNIRKLACALRIKLSEISDLEENIEQSNHPLKEYTDSWENFTLPSTKWETDNINLLSHGVDSLIRTLKRAFIITNALMNSTNFMFYIKDSEQKYITANTAFLHHFGMNSSQRIIGLSDDNIFSKVDAKINSNEDEKVLLTGEIITREAHTPGTKNKKWSLITKKIILDSHEKSAGLIGCYVDISEIKNSEKIRELLEINVKYMNCGLAIVDYNSNQFLYINEAYEKLYGLSAEQFYNDSNLWFSRLHPDDQKDVKEYRTSKAWPHKHKYRIIQPDNSYKWIEVVRDAISFQGNKCLIIVSREYHGSTEKIAKLKIHLNSLSKLSDNERKKIIDILE